jgi:hypothetical protein
VETLFSLRLPNLKGSKSEAGKNEKGARPLSLAPENA